MRRLLSYFLGPHSPPAPPSGTAVPAGFVQAREFLRGAGKDHLGRTITVVLGNTDDWFEGNNEAFEWLFPFSAPSGNNPSAPVLTPAELKRLGRDERAQQGLLAGYERFLGTLNIAVSSSGDLEPLSVAGSAYALRYLSRFTEDRITRALASMAATGLRAEAGALLQFLDVGLRGRPGICPALVKWANAALL